MNATPAKAHLNVRYVADLARLDLSDEEAARYGGQLDAVLDYIGQLNELDVTGIEPTAHAAPRFNVLREDVPGPTLDRRLVIANAPEQAEDAYIQVQAVMGGEDESA